MKYEEPKMNVVQFVEGYVLTVVSGDYDPNTEGNVGADF